MKKFSAEFVIDFSQRGLSKIEKEVFKVTQDLMKMFKNVKLSDTPFQNIIKKMEAEAITLQRKIQSTQNKLNQHIADSFANNQPVNPSVLNKALADLSKFNMQYQTIKNRMEAINSNITRGFTGKTGELKKKVLELKNTGYITEEEFKKLSKEIDKAIAKIDNPKAVKALDAINTKLEKTQKLINRIKKIDLGADAGLLMNGVKQRVTKDLFEKAKGAKTGLDKIKLEVDVSNAEKAFRKLKQIQDVVKNFKTTQAKREVFGLLEEFSKLNETDPKKLLKKTEELAHQIKKMKVELDDFLQKNKKVFNSLYKNIRALREQKKRLLQSGFSPDDKAIKSLDKSIDKYKARLDELKRAEKEIGTDPAKRGLFSMKLNGLSENLEGAVKSVKEFNSIVKKMPIEKLEELKNVNIPSSNSNKILDMYSKIIKQNEKIGKIKTSLNQKDLKELDSLAKIEKINDRLLKQYEREIQALSRLIESKRRTANPEALKKAEAEVEKLKKEYEDLNRVQQKVNKALKTSDVTIVSKNDVNRIKSVNSALHKTKMQLSEIKAQISGYDSFKYFTNQIKTGATYFGLYTSFYKVIEVFKMGVGYMVELDKATKQFQAVLDQSAVSAKFLEKQLAGIGARFGGELKEINEAGMELARAGLDYKDIAKGTEYVVKLAKLTGDSIATSSSALISYNQTFKDTGKTLKDFANQLAYTANASRLSVQDIGTFANYALATAKASGITMEAVNAMAVSFSNAGVNASTIGTQIRRFGIMLKDSSPKIKNFFKKLGLDQKLLAMEFAKGGEVADKALVRLIKRLKEMSKVDFLEATSGMNVLSSQVVNLMRNNADAIMTHLKILKNGVDDELEKADVMAESYIQKWEQLKNTAGMAFVSIMKDFEPTLKSALDLMKSGMEWIKENSASIVDNVKSLSIVLGSLAAIKSIPILVGGFKALKTAVIASTMALSNFSIQSGNAVSAFVKAPRKMLGSMDKLKGAFASMLGLFRKLRMLNPITWLVGLGIEQGISWLVGSLSGASEETEKYASETDKLKTAQERLAETEKQVALKRSKIIELMKKAKNATGAEKEEILKKIANVDLEIKALQKKAEAERKLIQVQQAREKMSEIQDKIKIKQAELEITDDPALKKKIQAQIMKYQEEFKQHNKIVVGYELELKKEQQLKQLEEIKQTIENLTKVKEEYLSKGQTTAANAIDLAIANNKRYLAELKQSLNDVQQAAIVANGAVTKVLSKDDVTSFVSFAGNLKGLMKDLSDAKLEEHFKTLQVRATQLFQNGSVELFNFAKQLKHNLELVLDGLDLSRLDTQTKAKVQDIITTMQSLQGRVVNIDKIADPAERLKEYKKIALEMQQKKVELENILNEKANQLTGETYNKLNELKSVADRSNQEFMNVGDNLDKVLNKFNKVPADLKTKLAKAGGEAEKLKAKFSELKEKYGDLKLPQKTLAEMIKHNTGLTAKFKEELLATIKSGEKFQRVGKVLETAIQKGISKTELLKKKLNEINSLVITPTIKVPDVSTSVTASSAKTKSGEVKTDLKVTNEVKKYHTGGVVGSDERVAVLQTGEVVLSRRDVSLIQKANSSKSNLKGLNKFFKDIEKYAKKYGKEFSKASKSIKKASKISSKSISKASKKAEKSAEKELKKKLALMKKEEERIKELQEFTMSIQKVIAENKNQSTIFMDTMQEFKQYIEKAKELGGGSKLDELIIELRRSTIEKKEKEIQRSYSPIQQGHLLETTFGISSGYGGIMKQDMESPDVIAKHYDDIRNIIKLKMEEINYEKERGLLKGLEAEKKLNKLELELTRVTAEQKASLAQAQFETKLALAKFTIQQVDGIISGLMQDGYIKSKRMFEFLKLLRVGEAIINTYAGASQALANPMLPYPMNLAVAGLIIAKGMAQVAAIKAQQPPRYHTGGYVDRDTANVKMGGLKDDEIPAILQKGEYVLSRDDVNKVKSGKSSNVSSGESEIVIINTIDPQVFAQYLTSREGTRIIKNIVGAE